MIPELECGPKRLPLSAVVVGIVVQMFPLVLVVAATVSLVVNVVAGQVHSVVGFVTFFGPTGPFFGSVGVFFGSCGVSLSPGWVIKLTC